MSILSTMGRWFWRTIAWFRPDAAAEPAPPAVRLEPRFEPDIEPRLGPELKLSAGASTEQETKVSTDSIGTESEPKPKPEAARAAEVHDFSFHHLRRDIADEAWRILERFEQLNIRKADYAPDDLRRVTGIYGLRFLAPQPRAWSTHEGR